MKLLWLLGFAYFFNVDARPGLVQSKYQYTMSLYYESNLIDNKSRSRAFVNGKQIKCICGQDPIMLFFVYGHIQGYCLDHIPVIDTRSNRDCKCKELK